MTNELTRAYYVPWVCRLVCTLGTTEFEKKFPLRWALLPCLSPTSILDRCRQRPQLGPSEQFFPEKDEYLTMSLFETYASFSNADIQQIKIMLEIRSYIRQNQEICPLHSVKNRKALRKWILSCKSSSSICNSAVPKQFRNSKCNPLYWIWFECAC